MSYDLFETRTMLDMVEQLYPPKTFLLDTFFKNVEMSVSENVDIDIVKGKRRLAPFVRRESKGKLVERTGYSTRSFKPAYVKMKMQTNAEELLKKLAGNTIYQGLSSPSERAAMQLAKDLAELQDMCVRREEWMAAQALFTGEISVVGEGYNDSIDFLFDATHQVTSGIDWSDANANPIDNLRTWFDLIGKDSGLNADVVVLGASAANAFLSHQSSRDLLDNRRIEMGQIDPRMLPSGAIYLGQLKDPAVDVYRYNEYFFNENTSAVDPMVPLKSICIGSSQARTARHYGLIHDLKAGDASVRWFPKTWEEEDPSVRWLLLQSAPLVCIHQPDAFLHAVVLP